MNTDRDQVGQKLDSVDRMLRYARTEYSAGRTEDAADLLRAADRNIQRAIKLLDSSADVVTFRDAGGTGRKEAGHAR
jgi:hypothetical protein